MARTDPQFMLRLPVAIRECLEEACQHNRRSLTAEILARLVGSFSADVQPGLQEAAARYTAELDITPAEAETLAKLRQITPRQRRAVLQLLVAMMNP